MNKTRAIELLKNFNLYDEPNCMGYWDCDECVEALYMGIEAIKEQPKRGKWIDREEVQDYIKVKYQTATCSNCFKVTMQEKWDEDLRYYAFCPNCGARMETEQ